MSSLWNDNVFGSNFKTRGQNGVHSYLVDKSRHLPDLKGGFKLQNSDFTLHPNESYFYTTNELRNVSAQYLPLKQTNILQPNSESYGMIAHLRLPSSAAVRVNGDGVPTQNDMSDSGIVPMNRMKYFPASYGKGDMSDVILPTQGDEYKTLQQYQSEMFEQYLKDQEKQNKRKPEKPLTEKEIEKTILPDPASITVEGELQQGFAEFAKTYTNALDTIDLKTLNSLSRQLAGLGDVSLSEKSKEILENYYDLFKSEYTGLLILNEEKLGEERYQSPVKTSYAQFLKTLGLDVKHELISLERMNNEILLKFDALTADVQTDLIKQLRKDDKKFEVDGDGMMHIVTNLTGDDRNAVLGTLSTFSFPEMASDLAKLQQAGREKYYEALWNAKYLQASTRALYEYTSKYRGTIVPYVPLTKSIESFAPPIKKYTSLIDENNSLIIPDATSTKSVDILNSTLKQLTEAIKQLKINNSYTTYQAEEVVEEEEEEEKMTIDETSVAGSPQGSRRSSLSNVESKEGTPVTTPVGSPSRSMKGLVTPKKTFYYDPSKQIPKSEKSKNKYADVKLKQLAATDLRESEVRKILITSGIDLVRLTENQKQLVLPLIQKLARGTNFSPTKIFKDFLTDVKSSSLTEDEKKTLDTFAIGNAIRTYQLQALDYRSPAGVSFQISSSSPEEVKKLPRRLLKRILEDKQDSSSFNKVLKTGLESESKQIENQPTPKDISEIKQLIEKLTTKFEDSFDNVKKYENLSKRLNILSSVQSEHFKKIAGKLQEIRQSQTNADVKFAEILLKVETSKEVSTAEATAIYSQAKEIYNGLLNLTEKVEEIDTAMDNFGTELSDIKIAEEINKQNIELLLGEHDAEIAKAQIELMKYVTQSSNHLISEYEQYAIMEMTKRHKNFCEALDTTQFTQLVEYEDNLEKMEHLYDFHVNVSEEIQRQIDDVYTSMDMNLPLTAPELKGLKEVTLPFFSSTTADLFPEQFTYQEAKEFLTILKSYVETASKRTRDEILINYSIPLLTDVKKTEKYYGGPTGGLTRDEIRTSFSQLNQEQKDYIQNICFKDFFNSILETNFRYITDGATYDVDQPGTLAVYYSFLFGKQAYDELVNSGKTFQHMCFVKHQENEIKFNPQELDELHNYFERAKQSFKTDNLNSVQQLSTIIQFGGLTGDFRVSQLNGLHPDVLATFLSNFQLTVEDCKLPFDEFYSKFVKQLFQVGQYDQNSLAVIDYTKTLLNEKTPIAQLLSYELQAAPKTMQTFFSCFEEDVELYTKLANYFDHLEAKQAKEEGRSVQYRTTLPGITFCQMANADLVTFRKMIYDAAAEYKGLDRDVYSKLVNGFGLVEGFIGYPKVLDLLLGGIEKSPDPKVSDYHAIRVKYMLNGQKVEATNAIHIKDFTAPVHIKIPGPLVILPHKQDGSQTVVALPTGTGRSSKLPTVTFTPTKKFTNALQMSSSLQLTPPSTVSQSSIVSPGIGMSVFSAPRTSIFTAPQSIPNILATTSSSTIVEEKKDIEMQENISQIDPTYTHNAMVQYENVFKTKLAELLQKNITDKNDKLYKKVKELADDYTIPIPDQAIFTIIKEAKTHFFKSK